MTSQVLTLLGGIGLFLFGMQTMTGALRQLATRRTRRFLARFTTTPVRGVLAGAASTALIQSSSATVMTVIGFVGAGLLTFPQALSVIFGANIGTTVTGWMVAILGLKFHLGTLAMPLLLAGSLAAMLGRGPREQVGLGLAGFSLVFIGLDLMQAGTAAIEPLLAAVLVPDNGVLSRLALVLAGAAVTVIVQASSAGVAATLVLLSGGSIGLVQAACLVIGMDIGTTFKSLLATIGGSRDMRRTAIAHVGYNLVTGIVAFACVGLVPYLGAALGGDGPSALVAFHTLFNVSGVVLLLPLTAAFARLIERLVPGSGGQFPEPLDRALLAEPRSALDAACVASGQLVSVLFTELAAQVRGSRSERVEQDLHNAFEDMEEFLSEISVPAEDTGARNRLSALLHLFDHFHRLAHRSGQTARIAILGGDAGLRRPARALAAALERAAGRPAYPAMAARLGRLHRLTAGRMARLRRSALLREHVGLVAPREVFDLTDALRWLERVFHHAERIVHYGAVAAEEEPTREEAGREDSASA